MTRICCANIKLNFFCSNSHISLQVSDSNSPLVVYVAKGFYGTTEISVAKVSRMRIANAELAYNKVDVHSASSGSGRSHMIIANFSEGLRH